MRNLPAVALLAAQMTLSGAACAAEIHSFSDDSTCHGIACPTTVPIRYPGYEYRIVPFPGEEGGQPITDQLIEANTAYIKQVAAEGVYTTSELASRDPLLQYLTPQQKTLFLSGLNLEEGSDKTIRPIAPPKTQLKHVEQRVRTPRPFPIPSVIHLRVPAFPTLSPIPTLQPLKIPPVTTPAIPPVPNLVQ